MIDVRKRYFVAVRHWFDRAYGNSYYTLRVFDGQTGEQAHTSGMLYGHGDTTYVQTARDLLDSTEIDLNNAIVYVTDVTRRRDL